MSKFYEFNLRPVLSLSVLALAALTMNSCAHAQSSSVRVSVPFAFQNGAQHLSAGTYTLDINQANHIMVIRGDTASGMSLIESDENRQPTRTGKVVFHCYGNKYFLREVWAPGASTHVHAPQSKAEKNAKSELELAQNSRSSGETEIALVELPH